MPRTLRLPAAVLLAALALAGCTTPTPMPTPPPTPDAAPVFASEEEALAAAEEAYGRYLSTVAKVLADGARSPERLLNHVSEDLYARDLAGYQEFAERHWRANGQISFTMKLQQVDYFSGVIVAYTCEDRSDFDVVDVHDKSVVPVDQLAKSAFEVTVMWTGKSLIVTNQESWNGNGVCSE